ncbi:MAG: CvpA family protein [Saprospiraceae bacterium]
MIDGLLLVIAGWGFYQGYSRGIISTVFTAFSFIFGLMVAFKLSPASTRFIDSLFKNDNPINFVIGFLLAFFITMIIIRTIAKYLEKALQSANINIINQVMGGMLLASIYTLIFTLFVWFADKSHIINDDTRKASKTYPYLKEFPGKMKTVYEYVKPSFQEFWQESVKFLDRMEEKSVEETETAPTIFDVPDETEKE